MAHVLPGLDVSDGILTATSVPEPDASVGEALWTIGATFAKGAKAISATLHWVWESAVDGNSGNALPSVADQSNDHWLSVGPTNRYAMFVQSTTRATVGASPLTVELTPGQRVDAVAIANAVADDVTIVGTKDGVEIYRYEQQLRTRVTRGWKAYFFGRFQQRRGTFRLDLPLSTGAEFTVTFNRNAGAVSVGDLGIGRALYLGKVRPNPASDFLNFSEWSRKSDGSASLFPRRAVPAVQMQVFVDKVWARELRFRRDNEFNGRVAFWSGIDDPTNDYFEPLFLVGFPTRWRIDMAPEGQAQQDIEIEER